MSSASGNRFQDFFEEDRYVSYKNHLYNYRLRKHAVEKRLQNEKYDLILELGSGISPVMTRTDSIVYSDLSFSAMKFLRRSQKRGCYLVADAARLPFKTAAFSHVVCSEVLEHLENDGEALQEICRVIKSAGVFLLTFPHRRAFFSNDDRYVNHYRRYDMDELDAKLAAAGLRIVLSEKVLGPMEKVTMSILIFILSRFDERSGRGKRAHPGRVKSAAALLFEWLNLVYMGLIWLDARMMPKSLSAVGLIKAVKRR